MAPARDGVPRRPPSSRAPRLIRFQLLWHSVTLSVPDELVPLVAYLCTDADHSFAPLATASYSVHEHQGSASTRRWRVEEEGDPLAENLTADEVLDVLYRRIHQRVFELASLRGWVRLHAATIDLERDGATVGATARHPMRVLLAATSGTGKSSVACRLRVDGVDVPADESVLIRDGIALPVPRRFHVKPGAAVAVPELTVPMTNSPRLTTEKIMALDPRSLAPSWHIAPRPVEAVVLLRRGERTSVQALPSTAAMPALVADCFLHQEPVGSVLREVATVLRTATCHLMTMRTDVRRPAGGVTEAAAALHTLSQVVEPGSTLPL